MGEEPVGQHSGQVLLSVPSDRYNPPPGEAIVDDVEEMERQLHEKDRVIESMQMQLGQCLAVSETIEHALEEQVRTRDQTIQNQEKENLLLKAGIIRVIEQLNTLLPDDKRKPVPHISMSAKGVLQHLEEVKNLLRMEFVL